MIITKINLYNFGIYAGFNTFEFSNKKPVVLIGGMNGRGKTTILEGVLLALYGPNSFAYKESRYHSYSAYLKSFVNVTDKSSKTYIDLEFTLTENKLERYLIHREWSGKSQRSNEKVVVFKNNVKNDFLSKNWSLYIENILPSGLSNFFFFDGEKIAALAVEETNAQLKESIKALLGITVLDVLTSDISRIINQVTKQNVDDNETNKLKEVTLNKELTNTKLLELDTRISKVNSKIDEVQHNLENAKVDYINNGGYVLEMRQELYNERLSNKLELDNINNILLSNASYELPLKMVSGLLKKILNKANKEHESRVAKQAFNLICNLNKEYKREKPDCNQTIEEFVEYVKVKSDNLSVQSIYNLSDQAFLQLKLLCQTEPYDSEISVKDSIKKAKKLQERIDEIDNEFSMDIDENKVSELHKTIKEYEFQIEKLKLELDILNKERPKLNGEVIKANIEFNRYVESLLNKMEESDDNERILKYCHLIIKILDEYKLKLQKNKTRILAKTMVDCYKKLASKKNLIEDIVIDPINFGIEYVDTNGKEIEKQSLSAGEQQLMVISLLWALGICSKKKLPVIIDTPLSRLDSAHREALLTTYFPNASEQTIILSTDSEVDRVAYNLLKPNIGDEFTLLYDDVKKCSTIEKGYFIGVEE